MRIIYFLALFISIVYAQRWHEHEPFGDVMSPEKDSLDVSNLPKEFREWHVRIVGDGYLRFVVPISMSIFADQYGDEEKIYIDHALHDDPDLADKYAFKPAFIIKKASCNATNPIYSLNMTADALSDPTCIDVPSSCTLIWNNTDETKSSYERDPSTCETILGHCHERIASTYVGLNESVPVMTTDWNTSTHEQGLCHTEYTVMLDQAVNNRLPGEKMEQVAVDGAVIRGQIYSIGSAGTTFVLRNLQYFIGEDGLYPRDFVIGRSVNFISMDNIKSPTSASVFHQVIRERDFKPAELRHFQPYINRTFIPAVIGDNKFKIVYSRYGLLHINKYRLLCNVNGLLVLGQTPSKHVGFIHVPEFYHTVTIRQSGHILVKFNDNSKQYIGQLTLVTFPNQYGLSLWSGTGFEIRCNGAGGFGTSLGTWCKNTKLDGKYMWYYTDTEESGDPEIKYAAAFSPVRLQQYHLNTNEKDLYLGGKEPTQLF